MWQRESERSGGLLGVRFVLTGGGGQCITVATYSTLGERDRRKDLAELIAKQDSMGRTEFLRAVSHVRPRTDDPISEQERSSAAAINAALDRAIEHRLTDNPQFVGSDLRAALDAATSYEPTLAEILPRIRLRPERMQEPGRWRIGYERDTTIAGYPAFASDDTLVTPDRPLLYRQVFWVVNRCAFEAIYQGTKDNVPTFNRLITSVQFPDSLNAPPR
jgi:hypothetical protein